MTIAVLGIDLGKNLCSLVGLDERGAVVLRRRVRRATLINFLEQQPACIVALEACCGAHHLGRLCAAHGHEVRLMPPEYVRPYIKAQKNDDRDAEGIAEAVTRPTMRFVPLKTQAQLDMQTLHRARERLVGERTTLINQLRAILFERGIIVPQGKYRLARHVKELLADPDDPRLSARMQALISDMWEQWQVLDERIVAFEDEFAAYAKSCEETRRLTSIPGVGVLTATALVAAIGGGESFSKGRDLAAWLGLVPRQSTTGGKARLMGISKRGNIYLRKLLIHGARAALRHLEQKETALGIWVRERLRSAAHKNIAIVALANKLARICWAVLRGQEAFASGKVGPVTA